MGTNNKTSSSFRMSRWRPSTSALPPLVGSPFGSIGWSTSSSHSSHSSASSSRVRNYFRTFNQLHFWSPFLLSSRFYLSQKGEDSVAQQFRVTTIFDMQLFHSRALEIHWAVENVIKSMIWFSRDSMTLTEYIYWFQWNLKIFVHRRDLLRGGGAHARVRCATHGLLLVDNETVGRAAEWSEFAHDLLLCLRNIMRAKNDTDQWFRKLVLLSVSQYSYHSSYSFGNDWWFLPVSSYISEPIIFKYVEFWKKEKILFILFRRWCQSSESWTTRPSPQRRRRRDWERRRGRWASWRIAVMVRAIIGRARDICRWDCDFWTEVNSGRYAIEGIPWR